MSDLISRSALIENIESLQVTITGLRAGKGVLAEYMKQYRNSAQNIIHEQPIAYDMEQVVKELEEKKHNFSGGSLQTIYYWKGIEEAIEIVKGGGVNG